MLSALCLLLALAACNKKDDKEKDEELPGYINPTDVAITGFYLHKDTKVLNGLDSVFFSIDLQNAVIFNADSLPKGTDITGLIPVISYPAEISGALITMEGGTKRQGEIDYIKSPNDSVDFTGTVKIQLTSSAGNSRLYRLKVNVHTQVPDTLSWGETALSKLPSRMAAPVEQRTVQRPSGLTALLREADGTYTVATTTDPASEPWTKHALTLPFTPRVRTLTAAGEQLAILDTEGNMYTSIDAMTWTRQTPRWDNIIGAFGDVFLGLTSADAGRIIASWPEKYPAVTAPEDFPVAEQTNMYTYQSQWMATPVSVVAGGVTASGTPSSAVWGFDGTRWAALSHDALPHLRGAVLVPYYNALRSGGIWNYKTFAAVLCLGGLTDDGEPNRTVYISYDNGATWSEAPTLLQLPDYIPGMWQSDAAVIAQQKQADLAQGWAKMEPTALPAWYRAEGVQTDGYTITWQCPYIYLVGGETPQGALYDTIWRGVLLRLSFVPII